MAQRQTYHPFSLYAGAVLVATGALVLVGWEQGIDLLKSVRPGLPTVKPNGALLFGASGLALILSCLSNRIGWFRWVAATFAVGVLALASLTLYQDVAGVNFGIDTFLYDETPNIHTMDEGRMSLNASLAFLLCGVALLLLSLRVLPVVVEGLAVLSGFVGLLGVLGYLYKAESLYGFGNYSRMSIIAAFAFLLLSFGILTARVDRGPMALVVSDTAAGVIMRRLLPIAIILPIVAGFIRLVGEEEGLYDREYGLALHVTSVIIVFVGLIWWNAISVYRAEMGRRRAENEIVRLNRSLKRRVAELQTVFEVAPVGLAVAHDPECRQITANPAFARILGVPPEVNVSKTGADATALPFKVRQNGQDLQPEALTMQHAAGKEQPVMGRETEIVREDGVTVTVLEYAAPLYDEDGKVRGALGAFVDISDLKRTQASLQAQSRTLETINRVNTQLAAELDVEQLTQTLTDAGRDLSGAAYGAFFYNVTSETGENYMVFTVSGADREAFGHVRDPHSSELFGPTFRGEGIIRLDDVEQNVRFGKTPPHYGIPPNHVPIRSYMAAPVVSRSGQVLGALFFGHPEPGVFGEQEERLIAGIADQAAIALENAHLYDMARNELSERKRVERSLRELNETLEARVAERTAALERANKRLRAEVSERARAERALERSNAALRHSNRELQDFAYVASHDLQEPLRKIGSFAGLLKTEYGDKLEETARFYVDRMQHGAERMSQLINDLLSFSRVTSRGSAFSEVDLNETMREVLSDLEINVREQNAQIDTEDLPTIQADPTQMHQLFQNLISNALKFQKADQTPHIRISATQTSVEDHLPGENHANCRIEVADNGIGFDVKYLEKVFSPFQRLHAQSEYPGTGMGLAICRRIVERHDGTITAQSEPGKGATFIIELPIRHASGEPSPAAAVSA